MPDKTFEEIVRPLMEWLANHHHPHTTIILTSTHAELVEGLIGFTTNDYIKD